MPWATYWRKPGGYSVITNQSGMPIAQDGRTIGAFAQHERHSFTCCHCNRVTWIESGQHQDIGRCTCCDDLICNQCIGKPCVPMEKAMGTYELRMRELDKRIEALQDKQTN